MTTSLGFGVLEVNYRFGFQIKSHFVSPSTYWDRENTFSVQRTWPKACIQQTVKYGWLQVRDLCSAGALQGESCVLNGKEGCSGVKVGGKTDCDGL